MEEYFLKEYTELIIYPKFSKKFVKYITTIRIIYDHPHFYVKFKRPVGFEKTYKKLSNFRSITLLNVQIRFSLSYFIHKIMDKLEHADGEHPRESRERKWKM